MSDLFENTAENGIISENTTDIVTTDKQETRVVYKYENVNNVPISKDLADLITKGVSRTISFARDIEGLDKAVKSSIALVMPEIEDGVIKDHTVTEENLDSAKKIYAKLNKLWTDLENDRKGMHKVTDAPYTTLNDEYKSKTRLLTSARDALKSQIATVEEEAANFKKKTLTEWILEKSKDYRPNFPQLLTANNNALFNARIWDDKFTNKTMTSTAMQSQVMSALAAIDEELKTIEAMDEHDTALAQYYQTGSLTDALNMQRKVKEAKDLTDRLSSERMRQASPAAAPQAMPQSEPAAVMSPQPSAPAEAPRGKIVLTEPKPGECHKYFHIWHDDPEAFTALTQYLRSNGFHRENMYHIYEEYLNN